VADALTAAMEEIKTQDGKFFITRSYDKAKQMLAQIIADAEKVKATLPPRKKRPRTTLCCSRSCEGLSAGSHSPSGKGSDGKRRKADIEALKGDLKVLRMHARARAVDGQEDYLAVIDKAKRSRRRQTPCPTSEGAMQKVKGK